MYPMATSYYEYHKPSKPYSSHSTTLHTNTKPNTANIKNTSYHQSNRLRTWHNSHDIDSSDCTSEEDGNCNHATTQPHKRFEEDKISQEEDANNASSDTATFDSPKNIIIRIDTVDDAHNDRSTALPFARDTSNTSTCVSSSSIGSSSSASSSSSSSCSNSSSSSASTTRLSSASSSSSSSSSSSCCASESSSETTYISFPDEEEENGRVREKLLLNMECGGVESPYSVTKKRSLSTNVTNNSHFLTITPVHAPIEPTISRRHEAQISRSMMVSPSSNDTDVVNTNPNGDESTVLSSQKFIFKFSDKDVVNNNIHNNNAHASSNEDINPFRVPVPPVQAAKQSISASTNTKVKIYALAYKVEMLTNKMNDMEEEWQRKEYVYREKIAKLNSKTKKKHSKKKHVIRCSEIENMKRAEDEKENERMSEREAYGLDIAYNLAEALHHKYAQSAKREEELKGAIDFYKTYCPPWLNERWIRVMFLWIIMIWMLSNIVITIKILINYYHHHGAGTHTTDDEDSLVIIWKLYILSSIYIWLEIFFILTLSIVSIYWKSKYLVHNPKENTWIRIVLMSIGAIVLLCNLSGIVFKLLSDGYWIKLMIGREYENIIKYTNYFIINVFSILIAVVCGLMIVRRICHGPQTYQHMFYHLTRGHEMRMRCYNHNLVMKCVGCILICDIFIFIESMYTFNDSFNDALLQPLLTICIDSVLIFLAAFMIHRTVMYHYMDRTIALEEDTTVHTHHMSMNAFLLNEYKRITFYDSFQLIVCLSPIADLITDSWTIYIYFASPNESLYALCALLILLMSFRFHIALWLLLKRRNENFIFNSSHSDCVLILVWFCWLLPFVSLFTNCFIHHLSVIVILLSITNEIILFFAPVFAPFIIIYQAAKDFIITFISIKFKHMHRKQNTPLLDMNHILDSNSMLSKINDVFADEYQLSSNSQCHLNTKQTNLVIYVRGLKRIGAAIPMFILQTFVICHENHLSNNTFRVTQYAISATSSLFIIIHSICWYYRNRK